MDRRAPDSLTRAAPHACGRGPAGCPTPATSRASRDGHSLRAEESEEAGDRRLHRRTRRDEIDHSVLDEKLRALKTLGQRLTDRLLDDPRSGETDQRFRLSDVQIAEHRVRRGDAAGG